MPASAARFLPSTGWFVLLAGLSWAVAPGELLAGAAVVVTALLVVAAVTGHLALRPRPAGHDPGLRGRILRERARRRILPRQLDPDAAGRPRPRAPSVLPSAG